MTKLVFTVLSVLIFCMSSMSQDKKESFTISGYVKEEGSAELLPGVTVYIPELKTGVSSNSYGFYSLTLSPGEYEVKYSFIGYETQSRQINLDNDMSLNIFIAPTSLALEEVVVRGDLVEKESEKSQMSAISIPVASIADIPAFLGEKDVLKVIQLMPGVQSGSEGSTGLYVRGGGPDQNLIILDDATVYNANHLFGFFSVFNGDALKSVELYKGGFPARFGGRLSSVIKMDMKDGNKEEVHGKVGVGILSSSLTVEGPITNGKTSFLVSGRRTYFDLLTLPFQQEESKGGYYFYDLNAKVNHEFNDKDKLYLSGYFGRDRFWFKDQIDTNNTSKGNLGWGNQTSTLRWNHQFNNRVFSNASFIFSKFNFKIQAEEGNNGDEFDLSYISSIRDYSIKYDVDYFPRPDHYVKFGVISTTHKFVPSALVVKEINLLPIDTTNPFNSLETAVYIEDDMKLFHKLNINAGIRFSHFIQDQVNYFKPEPRLSVAYQIKPNLALKASYASMNQYIHLLSNSGIGLPTDLWVSSTDRVKPQSSQQIALGLAKDITSPDLTVTLEGYYKKSDNVISYKEGASFLVIDELESSQDVSWEDNITFGQAWSYGIELLVKKNIGKFSGWIGYTLSKTEMQFDELNFGEKFLAKYDRTHDISIVGIYKKSERVTLSGTWVYGTGNNFTMPVGTYRTIDYNDNSLFSWRSTTDDYENKNNFKAEAYHRFDIGIQFHRKKKHGTKTWEFSIYNAYNRKNPFFYYIDNSNTLSGSQSELKKISIFPIIPSFKYTFEF